MNVLIVKLSALGDVIHALPVLEYLHQAKPGIEIDWIVEGQNRAVLEGHPLLRSVICVNMRAWRTAPFSTATRREVGAVISRLRAASYDAVLDLQGNIKSGIIARLTGVPERYGFGRNGVRESLNLLFTTHHVTLEPDDHHVSNRSLKIASAAVDGEYSSYTLASRIQTSPGDDHAAGELLRTTAGNVHILFHTGTTWETKKWSTEGWLQLGRLVLDRFPEASILFSWGNEQEYEEAQKLVGSLGSRTLLLPRLPLKTFCALMKQVDLVVGGDTGPIHIAAAVGTPTVSFYRATDAGRNAPRGPRHVAIQSRMPCAVCLERSCPKDAECRHSILATDLLEAMAGIIAHE